MDVTNHDPLYPNNGTRYYAAMAEAIEDFEAWEATRHKLGGGIQVFTTNTNEDGDGDGDE